MKDLNYNYVFDRVEKIANEKGYFCNRFSSTFPKFILEGGLSNFKISEEFDIVEKDVHYIHIHKSEVSGIALSILYDEDCVINPFFGTPNFEIYDGSEVERFGLNSEDVEELVKKAEELL